MKILFWARLPFAQAMVIERFAALPGVEFVVCRTLDDCIAAMPGTDGALVYNAKEVDARPFLEAIRGSGRQIRWMHFLTAGREGFDAVGIPDGILVTQTAGASAPVVAEHAFALLLALGRRLPELQVQAAAGRWDRSVADRCSSLEGKALAIVGYGHIGREVARRAQAFGMKVLAVSRSARQDEFTDEAHGLDSLHAVLARCEVVVVALALSPETRRLIGRDALAACPTGTLLVNVSRGAVVDQAALLEALASGHLGGAGLDVTDPEPPAADDPVWFAPNTLVTPHIAVEGSPPTAHRIAEGALQCFLDFQREVSHR